MVALSMGFSSFSFLPGFHPSYEAFWFLPRRVWLPLDVLAFPGRTT